MCRPILFLGTFVVLFIATTCSNVRIIYPTYRPPPQPRYPVIRTAREAGNAPLQLIIDDAYQLPTVNADSEKRYVRSLSTPSRSSGRASSGSKSSRGRDTGATHPGYNRRNAREAGNEPLDEFIRWPSTMNSQQRYKPSIYKDINLDPSVGHAGKIPSFGRSDGTSTGATHRGHNHRYTRSLSYPTFLPPFNPRPKPWNPPRFPIPMPQRSRFPIYV